MWAKCSSLRRSIRSSYMYRVFRLIDSELHVTRLKTRYLWNSVWNVWCGLLSICPSRLVTRRFALPGKKWGTLSFPLPCPCLPESQGKRAIPAKFAGGSFDLWRKFLVAALLRWISWSCCSPFSRSPSRSYILALLFLPAPGESPFSSFSLSSLFSHP